MTARTLDDLILMHEMLEMLYHRERQNAGVTKCDMCSKVMLDRFVKITRNACEH